MSDKKKKAAQKDSRNFTVFIVIIIMMVALIAFKFRSITKSRHEGSAATTNTEEIQDPVLKEVSKLNLGSIESQVAEKIRGLTRSIAKNPTSAELWGKLGMTLHIHDLVLESIPCYKRANELGPADFRWPYYCAIAMERVGSSETRDWFQRSLRIRNDYAPLHLHLGTSSLESGNIEAATSHFKTTLSLDPQNAHAYVGIAQIELRNADLQQAKKDLLTAIQLNPRHSEAHGLLADVYRRLREFENANSEQMIKQQLPQKTAIKDDLVGNLTQEGVSSFWHMMRARAHLQRNELQEAAKELEVAMQYGSDPRYIDLLGITYQQMHRYDEAIALHEKALKQLPNNVDFMFNLANAYFAAGRTQQGIGVMEQIKQLKPKSPDSYIDYAKFVSRTGDMERALKILREGHKQMSDNLEITVNLAWMLSTAKGESDRNGREAVQLAESARNRIGNNHAGTLKVLAAAYAETGQFQKAVVTGERAYQLASAEDPNLAAEIQKQLHLYEAHQPFRQ